MKSKLIFEFADHPHVIPPWVQFMEDGARVFTIRENLEATKKSLLAHGKDPTVFVIAPLNVLREFFFNNPFSSRRVVVVSTAPEFGVSVGIAICSLVVSLMRIDFLCIRSVARWQHGVVLKHQRFLYAKDFSGSSLIDVFKHRVSSSIGNLLRKLMLFKSNAFVFETTSQKAAFVSSGLLTRNKESFVFAGRLPYTSYNRKALALRQDPSMSKKSVRPLIIGVLGSVNSERRDYDLLEKVILEISKVSPNIQLAFLGAISHPNSEKIIQRFSRVPILKIHDSFGFVDEKDYLVLASKIDVVIAPLREDWGYKNGLGTGAIADALFLQKPLCLPHFMKEASGPNWINYYLTYQDLLLLLTSPENLLKPPNPEPDVPRLQNSVRRVVRSSNL
jgi:hypothetical protein